MKWSYENIIFIDYEFSLKEDIESKLWKYCIYRVIDIFRDKLHNLTRINKNSSDVKRKYNGSDIKNLSNDFNRFLEGSSGFYELLLNKFTLVHNLNMNKPVPHTIDQNSVEYSKYVSCYQFLIRLGDLTRYLKDIPHSRSDDWKLSKEYYKTAQYLLPHVGTAYNQLSILAIHSNDYIEALYYSYRSIAVSQLFHLSAENLKTFFYGFMKNPVVPGYEYRDEENFIQQFMLMNIYLYCGDYQRFNEISSKLTDLFISYLQSLSHSSTSHISNILFYLFTINIFSLYGRIGSKDQKTNTITEVLLNFTFDMYKLIINQFLVDVSKNKSEATAKYIPSIYILTLWISTLDGDQMENSLKLKMEEIRVVIKQLLNKLYDLISFEDCISNVILPEELELSGFIPLDKKLRSIIYAKNTYFITKDDDCNNERLSKLKTLLIEIPFFKTTSTSQQKYIIPVSISNFNELDDVYEEKFYSGNAIGSERSPLDKLHERNDPYDFIKSLFGDTRNSTPHPSQPHMSSFLIDESASLKTSSIWDDSSKTHNFPFKDQF